jgi:tRNA A58 N-methylase Trm61
VVASVVDSVAAVEVVGSVDSAVAADSVVVVAAPTGEQAHGTCFDVSR